MAIREHYNVASVKTADDLRSIALREKVRDLSSLSLPEIDKVVDRIAQLVPAGNVPAMIFSGLARLTERKLPPEATKNDIALLFKGVEQMLDTAVYAAFFAGPAAVIAAYQNLLKLAGKDPDASFPEGTWQFYIEYALREDTARHANETVGFDMIFREHGVELDQVDRFTAWVMAAIHCLAQYDALLANEWYERVTTYALVEATRALPDAARYAQVYRDWERMRPYMRDSETQVGETYPEYRRRKFRRFLTRITQYLPLEAQQTWQERLKAALDDEELDKYQTQMSILAYLEPGPYGETRHAIDFKDAFIGVIYRGHYYLIPACRPGKAEPARVDTVREQTAAILASPPADQSSGLSLLAGVRRAAVTELRSKLSNGLVRTLDTLHRAPILLNFDAPSRERPLSDIRQAERGVGDHPLTIFDTGESFVFDQSHIFFDGAWGAALAEILTNEAAGWAAYLHEQPPLQAGSIQISPLACTLKPEEAEIVNTMPRVTREVCAENDQADLEGMLLMRRRLKQRSAEFKLTVNDLLVLYRAIHTITYKPDAGLMATLKTLTDREGQLGVAASVALEALQGTRMLNPAILLPIDASRRTPRDRVYPMSFEIPLGELDVIGLHQRTVEALKFCQDNPDNLEAFKMFSALRGEYLSTLAGFGEVFSQAKAVAIEGKTDSINTIKLLANMSRPLQRMLNKIPDRFEVLNDIIRGREVFSNVGAVVPGSTLTRFTTAKDDNDKKTLAWGVLTDAEGVMHITLRDFRRHVGLLAGAGRFDLAQRITQDYLDAYVHDLNIFIRHLRLVAETRRRRELIAFAD